MDQNKSLQDRIPSDLSDQISKEFTHKLSTDELRNKVREILNESVDSVPFMKKIKEYAGEEINDRIFKSQGYLLKTTLIPILLTILTVITLKLLKLN